MQSNQKSPRSVFQKIPEEKILYVTFRSQFFYLAKDHTWGVFNMADEIEVVFIFVVY